MPLLAQESRKMIKEFLLRSIRIISYTVSMRGKLNTASHVLPVTDELTNLAFVRAEVLSRLLAIASIYCT